MPESLSESPLARSRDSLRGYILRVVALLVAPATLGVQVELFVSPRGSDTNPGTAENPFASLEAARDALRARRRQNAPSSEGATVWLQGGDHVRTNAFDLTAEDSGTAGAPIVWRAAAGKSVRLLGGRRLEGFQPVVDPAVLERLEGTAREQVRWLDLQGQGIREPGGLASRGFGRPAAPSHPELFFGGRPMTLARWPNEGAFESIAGFPDAGGEGDGHGGQIGKLEGGFLYAGDRPRRWQPTPDLWVHGYWAWDWANSYERVAELDLDQRRVRTAPPHGLYGFRKGQRFYFLNILEELDQPGEWYLDRPLGRLYFWPPAGPGRETLLSLLDQPLIRMTDVAHVALRGVILEATRGTALEVRGGLSNRVAGCIIRNVGNHGVSIQGGIGHTVEGCDIFDTGDGGVVLEGGDRKTLTPAGHLVDNCHFQRQGRWSKCYVPAVQLQGVGMRVSHCLIHDHPHCAILYWGNDHQIEFNEIHHVALETGDVGAIYTGRDYTFRGNRIRHNYLHHTGGVGMGSMGAYMDDCVSGTEIFGNIFYHVQRAAFLGGGRDHAVVNNVFVECRHAVELDGRGLDPSPVWRGMVDDTMRQRLADIPLALYRERYPALRELDPYYGPPEGPPIVGDAFKGVPPGNNLVARNICVGPWLNLSWHAKPGMLRLENNLTDADPRFVGTPRDEAKAVDFALKDDSPAWALGFERLPVEQIGLRDDALRRSLPNVP